MGQFEKKLKLRWIKVLKKPSSQITKKDLIDFEKDCIILSKLKKCQKLKKN